MRQAVLLLTACVALVGCRENFTGEDDATTTEGECSPGAHGCPCADGNCLGDLECVVDLNVCADPEGTDTGDTATDDGTDATDTDDTGMSDTGDPGCVHRVFVTSMDFYPVSDFASLEEADTLCQTEADVVLPGSTFRAVLSGPNSASMRLTLSGSICLADDGDGTPDDTLVATEATWWSPSHAAPIQRTASGSLVPDTTEVWTGTKVDGLTLQNNCTNWQDGEEFGGTSKAAESDERWIAASNQSCNERRHLYCLEQF